MKKISTARTFILLHILLMIFSVNSVFSKYAAAEDFLSIKWCICYAGVILLLGIYAIGWQQIIKRMPLISAYANRAVTVIWGIVWGVLFFDEKITLRKILGALLIIIGVIIFARSDNYDDLAKGGDI